LHVMFDPRQHMIATLVDNQVLPSPVCVDLCNGVCFASGSTHHNSNMHHTLLRSTYKIVLGNGPQVSIDTCAWMDQCAEKYRCH
jgi:hypothetical protein